MKRTKPSLTPDQRIIDFHDNMRSQDISLCAHYTADGIISEGFSPKEAIEVCLRAINILKVRVDK